MYVYISINGQMQENNWNFGKNIASALNDLMYTVFNVLFYSRANKKWVLEVPSNQTIVSMSIQNFLNGKCYYLWVNLITSYSIIY